MSSLKTSLKPSGTTDCRNEAIFPWKLLAEFGSFNFRAESGVAAMSLMADVAAPRHILRRQCWPDQATPIKLS